VGGVENVVADGHTGFLCPINDVESFGNRLMEIIDNDELRASMAKQGWAQVGERYHYSRLIEETSGLFHKLLD
jgi:glycosyltransferase involved in cell wall biosynthesis